MRSRIRFMFLQKLPEGPVTGGLDITACLNL